jgi:hypothetical protein
MKIAKFNQNNCAQLGEEIEAALKGIADKHGVLIKRRGGSFSSELFSIKLEIATVGEHGAASREAEDFKRYAGLFGHGLEEAHLGKEFELPNGKKYQLKGFMPRRRKFPFLCKDMATGKDILLQEMPVQRAFGVKPRFSGMDGDQTD